MEYLLNNAFVRQNLVVKQINIKDVDKLRRLQELGLFAVKKKSLLPSQQKTLDCY